MSPKRRQTGQKREREQKKRDRQRRKAELAAEKRQRRFGRKQQDDSPGHGNADVPPDSDLRQVGD